MLLRVMVQHAALSHPEVSFRFLREGKEELSTPGDGSLKSAVYAVLGRDVALGLLPCKGGSGEDIAVEGFISQPVCCRGSRAGQFFFVNGRYVKSRTMQAALEQAYRNQKMVGKFPACVLHLTTRLSGVDVNVHPTKTEALDLFPGAQLPQAVAHLAAPPAPVAALGAQGGVVQAVRGKSALGEHLAALLLEGLVLLPDLRHPGGGIGAVVKGGGGQRQHARPEPGVNLFYLGQGLVDLGAHPALLGLMGGPAAV